jgi:NADH:ubiquinone oxidoreductase subunit E
MSNNFDKTGGRKPRVEHEVCLSQPCQLGGSTHLLLAFGKESMTVSTEATVKSVSANLEVRLSPLRHTADMTFDKIVG